MNTPERQSGRPVEADSAPATAVRPAEMDSTSDGPVRRAVPGPARSGDSAGFDGIQLTLEREKITLEREKLAHEREKLALERDRLQSEMEQHRRLKRFSVPPFVAALIALVFGLIGVVVGTVLPHRLALGLAGDKGEGPLVLRAVQEGDEEHAVTYHLYLR